MASNVVDLADDRPHASVPDHREGRPITNELAVTWFRFSADTVRLQLGPRCAQSLHIRRSKTSVDL